VAMLVDTCTVEAVHSSL